MSDDKIDKMDIEQLRTFYRYMRADRDGWQTLYFDEMKLAGKLGIAVVLMAIPAVISIIQGILWLYNHVHFYFT